MVWYSHLLKNFVVTHKVKDFGVVKKADVLIHRDLIYESSVLYFPSCLIATITFYLFLNVLIPQLKNQLMDFVCINCFIIALNVMPYESECTSKDFFADSLVRTLPSNLSFSSYDLTYLVATKP